jgi:hypothetical protein
MSLPRPVTTQPHYGAHLGDVEYWSAYVSAALDRHGIPHSRIEAPFVGSFPTFLAGDVVVKLFADTFDGPRSFAVEKAMYELLSPIRDIPAPGLVAEGQLFDDPAQWNWPYLISERLAGTAVRDLPIERLTPAVAERLGAIAARLHSLPVPSAVAARDLPPSLRCEAPDRLRGHGLPEHLVEQVPEFLADAPADRVLVHADLTADHLFLDSSGLVGIIDWGDAVAADPWYELVALRFDGLRTNRPLFEAFLDGYGWPITPQFPVRALQGVLEFQFNVVHAIAGMVDLGRTATLHDLAYRLFPGPVAKVPD